MKIQNTLVKEIPSCKNYAISKDSKVFRISTGKEMKKYPRGISGYLCFRTCENNVAGYKYIHVALAEAWIENNNPNKTQVNHIDGDKLNNNLDNLEWVTPAENQRHAIDTGLKGSCDELYNSSMSDDIAHLVCQDLEQGMRVKDVADKYGLPKDNIRKIKAGDTYFKIRVLYNIDHEYKTTLSESTVRWVCEKVNEGISDKNISKQSTNPNVTTIEVKRIRYKIRYKNISDEYF